MTSMGPSRSLFDGTASSLQPEEIIGRGLQFHVCTINKSVHMKKRLETYLMIIVYFYPSNDSNFLYLIGIPETI